jgi:hypothetical protein
VGCDRSPLALVVLAQSLEQVLDLANVEDLRMLERDEHVDKSRVVARDGMSQGWKGWEDVIEKSTI